MPFASGTVAMNASGSALEVKRLSVAHKQNLM
jgi:hypothetical protein